MAAVRRSCSRPGCEPCAANARPESQDRASARVPVEVVKAAQRRLAVRDGGPRVAIAGRQLAATPYPGEQQRPACKKAPPAAALRQVESWGWRARRSSVNGDGCRSQPGHRRGVDGVYAALSAGGTGPASVPRADSVADRSRPLPTGTNDRRRGDTERLPDQVGGPAGRVVQCRQPRLDVGRRLACIDDGRWAGVRGLYLRYRGGWHRALRRDWTKAVSWAVTSRRGLSQLRTPALTLTGGDQGNHGA